MSELVALDGFSLLPQGPTLSLGLAAGHSMAVIGMAGSGKSRLLRCVQSREKPGQGRADALDRWVEAGRDGFWRRATPTSLSRKWAGGRAGDASHAVSAAGLWDVRTKSIDDLSGTQLAACELLRPLAASDPVMFVDGQLDGLDHWTLSSVIAGFKERLSKGACLIVGTNRLELCPDFDLIVVMREGRAMFAGTYEELLREGGETEIVVESRNQPGVRALVDPFEVSIQVKPEGLVMRSVEGQAIAAKLLMEGYGDVKTVVVRAPTVEDAVSRIVGR